MMLLYTIRQFAIKIKTTTTIIYSWKNTQINYLKTTLICLCHIIIEMMPLKKLMLIKQVHQKSGIFVTVALF